MAIAPINKFISIAAPVAPGEQKVYEVPTGVSAILLYAQVSNVGVNTYPSVTLIHRRESRSTGNKRDTRIIKEIEVPPNDAAILVDGRLVLQKDVSTIDTVYIKGNQTGINTIMGVVYDEPTGIATFTTYSAHGFSANDEISLAGISFECSNSTGITTTIFPDPQRSYTIDTVPDTTTFTSVLGSANGINHTYVSARHQFLRARNNAVTVVSSSSNGVEGGTDNGTQFAPTNIIYEGATGIATFTYATHGLSSNDTISLTDNSLIFSCSSDNFSSEHSYPRSTDPASTSNTELNSGVLSITRVDANNFYVNVGLNTASGFVGPLQMEFFASILENSST